MRDKDPQLPPEVAASLASLKEKAEAGIAEAQVRYGLVCAAGGYKERDLALALEWFQKAADQGSAFGIHCLAHCYLIGGGVDQDLPKAIELFRQAADLGFAEAFYFLGCCHLHGQGVPVDLVAAEESLIKAAEGGCVRAQYFLSNLYESGDDLPKDSAKSLYWLRTSAENGDSQAQVRYALKFLYGEEGVPLDKDEALSWLYKAANQPNSVVARFFLYYLFSKNEFGPSKAKEALKWLEKSFASGYPPAVREMGLKLIEGVDLPRNMVNGLELLKKAGSSGDDGAYFILSQLYSSGRYGVPINVEKAKAYLVKAKEMKAKLDKIKPISSESDPQSLKGDLPKAAGQGESFFNEKILSEIRENHLTLIQKAADGDPEAMIELGAYYYTCPGQGQNFEKAAELFRSAGERGASTGYFNLGLMVNYGDGLPLDKAEAANLFLKAAEMGLPIAQRTIAVIYLNGDVWPKDVDKFLYWLKKAVSNNDPEACYLLGLVYFEGKDLPQDFGRTAKYYRKAARLGLPKAWEALAKCYDDGLGVRKNPTKAKECRQESLVAGVRLEAQYRFMENVSKKKIEILSSEETSEDKA